MHTSLRQIGGNPALDLARRNAALLIAVIYLQDVFWLVASRVNRALDGPSHYAVAPLEALNVTGFVLFSLGATLLGLLMVQLAPGLQRIKVNRMLPRLLVLMAIALNVTVAFVLDQQARYTSGGLVGANGVLYALLISIGLASMVVILRTRGTTQAIPRLLVTAFVLTYCLRIDGLAAALTIVCFGFIYLNVQITKPLRIVVIGVLAFYLLELGIAAKFDNLPDHFTPQFMLQWVVSRFSIQAEHAYAWVAGEGYMRQDWLMHWTLVMQAIEDRYDIIVGNPLTLEYPRNVAEALYYDAYGSYSGGSSPGLLLGTLLAGPVFFMVPTLIAFAFVQVLHGWEQRLTLPQACLLAFILKPLHANSAEHFVMISPNFAMLVVVLAASIFTSQEHKFGLKGGTDRPGAGSLAAGPVHDPGLRMTQASPRAAR